MGEQRYWRAGHPERTTFAAWVSGAFQGLYASDGPARGAVWVRPYVREGHRVAGHWRSPPEGSGSDEASGEDPRRPDAEGRDAVDDLRAEPDTRRERNLPDRADQWSRTGGEATRARDLERLRPAGPPEDLGNGVTR
jgi:hypothetical protein